MLEGSTSVRPSVEDDDRRDVGVDSRRLQDGRTGFGVSTVEGEWHVVALQQVAHLVHPCRSFGADDVHRCGARTADAPPLVEQFGDAAVKPFVGGARWLGDEAFRLSLCERDRDLLTVRPALVPVEQQPATGVRVHHSGLVEEHGSVRRSVGQDQRNVAVGLGERPHALTGRDDVGIGNDRVVVRVPGDQLLDGVRGVGLGVDDEDDRLGCGVH